MSWCNVGALHRGLPGSREKPVICITLGVSGSVDTVKGEDAMAAVILDP